MDQNKLDFLQNDLAFRLKHVAPDAEGKWGKMNGQQMVEHLVLVFKNANGKLKTDTIYTPPEELAARRELMMSDEPFDQNFRSPVLPEDPLPQHFQTINEAIEKLKKEIKHWVDVYTQNPSLTIRNPVYGDLNYSESIQLLYKHARHHLAQFGIDDPDKS